MVRRLSHNLLTIAAVPSLVLCTAISALWVRSYRTSDFVIVTPPRPVGAVRHGYLITGKGGIGAGVDTGDRVLDYRHDSRRRPGYGNGGWPEETSLNQQGFATSTVDYGRGTLHGAIAPAWFLVCLTMICPVWAFTRWQERRRLRLGLCPHCGHDPGGATDRCPSCGTPLPRTAGGENP